jgi:hypothetical protein
VIPGFTPGGSYSVQLHFAELYWSGAGQRVFNVAINGTTVLTHFDIIAAAGAKDKAIVEQFPATANGSGNITIVFTAVTDQAKISGVYISPAASPSASNAVYALVSFGPNGHGAYARGAGTTNLNVVTSRINVGSVNTDEQTNCNCNSSAVATTFAGTFVQKTATQDPATPNRTNDFDDVVAFSTRADLRSMSE